MQKDKALYLFLIFLIFFPVLNISGHFVNLVEFYIYFLFFYFVKDFYPLKTARIFTFYFILFFIVSTFTAILVGKSLNNHDFFIMRNCIQLIILLCFFYKMLIDKIKIVGLEKFEKIIYNCFIILSIPALVVIFQKLNLFKMREIVKVLYQPQFFYLGPDLFADFRYTSVFKDFFTAGTYFVILSTSLYYFYLKTILNRKCKGIIIFLLLLIYVSQVFVARTSLVLIPINIILLKLFASRDNLIVSFFKVSLSLALLVPVFYLGLNFLIDSNIIPGVWVNEGFNLLLNSDSHSAGSSFQVMQNWNQNFFSYLFENPYMLIRPFHEYDLKESGQMVNLYTDGFYPQEIYRYGIYGLLIYCYLLLILLKEFFRKSFGLFLIVLSFAVLNYKGGNVFFMAKNIYMYSFVFVLFLIIDKVEIGNTV